MTTALMVRPPEAVEGEIVGNGLFLEANPFQIGSFKWVDVPEGATLTEHYSAAAAQLPPAYRPHVELWLEEHRIDRQHWSRTRPKPGVTVYARVRPHGGKGGKNVLRAFLMIAIVVAASIAFAPAGGFIATTLGLTGTAAAVASAVIVAVVTTVGMLAVNALIPAPGLTGDNSIKDPKYQLTGSSNRFAPYAPIPRVFGKMKLYPVLAGYPYTEVVGNKQYLRLLLLVGWGPLKISNIKIGETPITSFRNVEIEITEGGPSGWAGNVPITLYNRKVNEQQLSVALTSAGGASTAFTTALNTVEISCDLTFPFGLIHIAKDGTRSNRSVAVKVEYRVAGSAGAWLAAPLETAYNDSNQSVNGGTGVVTATAATSDMVRANARFKVAANQYEVRLTRQTADAVNSSSGAQDLDGTYWTTLRSFSSDAPVNQGNVCMIAIRMQASDQLNGTPDNISCIAESYLPVYGIGSEMVTNGDGSSTTGWTAGNSASLASVSGRLRVSNGAAAGGYATQAITTIVGHRYLIAWDKFAVGGGATDARVRAGTAANGTTYLDDAATGDVPNNQTIITASTTSLYLTLMCDGPAGPGYYAEFDNISVKDLDANTSWTYQITRSPAWAFADILRRRAGLPFNADARINLPAIQAWNAACGALAPNSNEPRWTYDGVIEGGTVYEALRQVAAIGRAAYTMHDGKFSVVQDKAQSTPVQLITPRNSWGYSGSRLYLDQPHALRVEFQNRDLEYRTDERIVYADGYSSSNATRFEVLQLIGCTSKDLAFREARYHLAVAALRPEEHRVSMDIEGLRCTMGDRVQLAYDVMSVGKTWGRITGLNTSGANTIAFVVDEDCTFETGVTYQFRVRHADGTISMRAVTMTGGPGTTRTLTCSAETTAGGPQVGDVYIFGETNVESAPMIVKKIEPGDEMSVILTLANYDAGIYTADTGTIPAFFSYISTDAKKYPPTAPTVALRSDTSTYQISDGLTVPRIAVDIYNGASRIPVAGNEVQYRESSDTLWRSAGSGTGFYAASVTTVYINVLKGHTYQVRVRAKGENGIYSDWVQPSNINGGGTGINPAQPTSATATSQYQSILLTWTNPAELDFDHVDILSNTSNNSASAVVVGSSTTGRFTHSNLVGGIAWFYWLRAVDKSGNFSTLLLVDANGTMASDVSTGGDNMLPDADFTGGTGVAPSVRWSFSGGLQRRQTP